MLIFTLPSWYKSDSSPGNSIFIFEQMMALQKLGHKIIVLSVQPVSIFSRRRPNRTVVKVNDNGIITYSCEIQGVYPSKWRGQYVAAFEKALQKLYAQAIREFGKPDVLYAHFSYAAGYLATKLGKTENIPVVIQEHYSGLMEPQIDRSLRKYIKEAVKGSTSFICVSPGLQAAVKRIVGEEREIKVISNMINPCFRHYPHRAKSTFVFFSMGGLIKRKGFDLLIKAFADEFTEQEKVRLIVAGSGAEHKELTKMISQYGEEDRIELCGQLSREETLQAYCGCDCFVLPSRAETYGLVYREAMAVGRPIISTKHGGFGEADWHDEYGYLIDIDDLQQLKMAMREVFENYSKYDSKQISSLCLADCSENAVITLINNELLAACHK